MTEIWVGGIGFNDNTPDENGSLWYIESMDGWTSPPLRTQVISPPSRHGGVTAEGLFGPRTITFTGICKSTSKAAYHLSMNKLMSELQWLTPNFSTSMDIEEEIWRSIRVVLASQVRTRPRGMNTFEFNFAIRSDDPAKYASVTSGDALVANTPETHVNEGTWKTYPKFTLTSAGQPTITVGSLTWAATDTLPSGTTIDMKEMTCKQGSIDHFGKVDLSSDWLYYEPGNNTVESSVACNVVWWSAWI